jgi:ribosomal protein S6--L-glutamate ligase
MKAGIISLGSKSSKKTAETMKKYFDQVDEINLKNIEINFSGKKSEVLYNGEPLDEYDCIIAKGSFRYAPLLRSLTTLLKDKTYLPIEPDAFTLGHDKLLTHLKLQQHNIPMPRTYLNATVEGAKKLLERVNYPIIMKFPQGTQGKGIMFADSYASASSVLDALSALRQPFIVQEFIDTGGTDIRAIVVGDKVVASMKRKANIKEVRANIHAGGIGESIELDSYTKKIAVDAAKSIGAHICGVDLLETIKGPVVIEVNVSPGLTISELTGIDVADKIAKYLYKQTLEMKNEKKSSGTAKMMNEFEADRSKEIISTLDFRGTRILLPEVITKISGLNEIDNVEIKAEKNKITLKKFELN